MIVLFFFIIISGSRSSLLSACLIIIFYFLRQKNKVRYFIIGAASILFIVLLLGNRILNYSQQVSFQKRQEAQEMGISDETYRKEVLIDAMNMSWENIGHFVFGFGAGDFKKALSRYYAKYRHNELSSHNTYLEVFITGGLLTFTAFFFLYVIFPLKNFYAKNREMLYVFIPLILIATTEDNFGLGQFLFVVFSLFSFYSFKI
jgi:O-antigen ligase